MTADSPTGVRLGAVGSGTGATYTSYVTVDVPDTGSVRNQTLTRTTDFNTFVTQNPVVPDDTLLTVGGEPSSRALVRFGVSDAFLDSTTIVRATLELHAGPSDRRAPERSLGDPRHGRHRRPRRQVTRHH